MRENGFLQLRRGFWAHRRDGRMSVTEALAFIYICSEADTRTGIWSGCAKALAGELGISERTARDVLEKLEQGGYIRRWTSPGRHWCYPILVHKFPLTSGGHNGEQLNAIDSKSPVDLVYFPRAEDVVLDGKENSQHGAAQKRIENRNRKKEKKNPAAKPTPPADPRREPFIEFAYRTFQLRFGQKPSWQGKDWQQLKNLLAATSATLEEIQARWQHYLVSTEPFTANKRGSLAYFCANFDAFIEGPLHGSAKGGAHGKLSGDDLTRANLKAAGYPVN